MVYTATDTVIAPILETMRECLALQTAELQNPPEQVCIRPGPSVTLGVSVTEDECCDGLAWVRYADSPPSSQTRAPAPDPRALACGPIRLAVTVELGIARCAPVGDSQTLPTCQEWEDLAFRSVDDMMALRRTVACYAWYLRSQHRPAAFLIQDSRPVMLTGGCSTVALTATWTPLNCDPDPVVIP